jgi:hypothetical protein
MGYGSDEQLPMVLQSSSQSEGHLDRVQLPVPSQRMVQPPSLQSRVPLPSLSQTKRQPLPSQLRSQLPIPLHSQVLPGSQSPSELPMQADTDRASPRKSAVIANREGHWASGLFGVAVVTNPEVLHALKPSALPWPCPRVRPRAASRVDPGTIERC